jgi:hypothetical protein
MIQPLMERNPAKFSAGGGRVALIIGKNSPSRLGHCKRLLAKLLRRAHSIIVLNEHYEAEGENVFR